MTRENVPVQVWQLDSKLKMNSAQNLSVAEPSHGVAMSKDTRRMASAPKTGNPSQDLTNCPKASQIPERQL